MRQNSSETPQALSGGAAMVDITSDAAGPADGPLYAKALVLQQGETTVAVVTVDAVAIAEIGSIRKGYLETVREALGRDPGIAPERVVVNASHCHGRACGDVAERTIAAVRRAHAGMVPVRVGAGVGREDRVSINRRLRLKSGAEADERRAYALPPEEDVAGVGPIDPEIAILRLDREDGTPLAILYNFAVHPIMGVASGRNTSDLTGFASRVIEQQIGGDAIALFVQGCAGNVNPIGYKDAQHPHDAQALGTMLGLSALEALRDIETREDANLKVAREVLELPRADLSERIASLEAELAEQLRALKGTTLDFKTFLPLMIRHGLFPDAPSYPKHRYLHERAMGREGLDVLDAQNRRDIEAYLANIHTMERLTRIQTNLGLLKMHQARGEERGERTVEAEVVGLRVGSFAMVTFPGELSVEIGLGIKERSPHPVTAVAGVTNGYIYYTPTVEQLENRGGAQEDSDCFMAPEWQAAFENLAGCVLERLGASQ